MNFKQKYPDFAAIEGQIRAARAERAVYLSQVIVEGLVTTIRGLKKLGGFVGRNLAAERDRRAIEADAFLKRWVPKY